MYDTLMVYLLSEKKIAITMIVSEIWGGNSKLSKTFTLAGHTSPSSVSDSCTQNSTCAFSSEFKKHVKQGMHRAETRKEEINAKVNAWD